MAYKNLKYSKITLPSSSCIPIPIPTSPKIIHNEQLMVC